MMLTLLAVSKYEGVLLFFIIGAIVCFGMSTTGKRSKK